MESGDQADNNKKRKVGLNYMSVNDWAGDAKEQEWLWHKAIPLGHLTIIQAAQKVGKSTLVRNLIAAVVEGREFLGRAVKRGSVVYLPIEESPTAVKQHLEAVGVDATASVVIPTVFDEHCKHSQAGRVVRDTETLAQVISEIKPVLVVIDPLTLFLKSTSLNSYDKVYSALEPLIHVAQANACAIVFLHHESKSGSGRANVGQRGMGSVALPAAVAATISMTNKNGVRMLESEGRDIEPFAGLVLSMDEHGVITAGSAWDDSITDKYSLQILEALAVMSQPLAMVELQMLIEGDVKQVKSAIYSLIERGEIVHVSGRGVKGDPKMYGLPQTASADGE